MESNIRDVIKEIIPYILIIIFAVLVKKYVVSPIRVNGASMDNTLRNGDIMILNKIGYSYDSIDRFDIVVVKYGDEELIKRIIGLPGELVEYKDNKLYIDGKLIKENFSKGKTEDFSFEVPAKQYFVMGDNREVSLDSRKIGSFSLNDIDGSTSLVIFPFNRFGKKE